MRKKRKAKNQAEVTDEERAEIIEHYMAGKTIWYIRNRYRRANDTIKGIIAPYTQGKTPTNTISITLTPANYYYAQAIALLQDITIEQAVNSCLEKLILGKHI